VVKIPHEWKVWVDVPWKVGAVVGVDDKILLSVEETAGNRHGVGPLLLQQSQEVSEVRQTDTNTYYYRTTWLSWQKELTERLNQS